MAVRESIIDNIVDTLKTITVAGGYNNDVGLVSRQPFGWNTLKPENYPAALVVWKTETKDATGLQGQHIMSTMVVTIRGVVYAKEELETELNEFLDDVEKALCADTDRGALAEYTDPVRITVYQTEIINFAVFDFDFEVVYQYLYGSP